MSDGTPSALPLAGIKLLDLTRILAGPTATQLLGDLGADVVKVERPGKGDDTRGWGPPYLADADGKDSGESAYFLCANRAKRSITVDFANDEGQALARRLAREADIIIENFKTGGLKAYGLDYPSLQANNPGLVYCSITGFGQTGPYAARAGYDFLVQGMGGIMSLTGEPEGEPMKVGIGIADVMCGMYAANAVQAALIERQRSGRGQYIDLALLDTQVAWLIYEATNYLVSGQLPIRRGNAHPNIVPYQAFATADGHIILAVGNDGQFAKFCAFAGRPELATDERFANNRGRSINREALLPQVAEAMRQKTSQKWLDGLAPLGVPCGPINDLDAVFADPQVQHRGMKLAMPHPYGRDELLHLLANPINYGRTPIRYERPPPKLGEHTDAVLKDWLALDETGIAVLRQAGALG